MKLELKHLSGYLPYGLKMTKNGFIGELEIIKSNGEVKVSCSNWWESEYKPILRPLSDLTKEIYVNGEKFVPIEWFEIGDDSNDSIEYSCGNVKLIGLLKDMANHNFIDLKYMNYGVIEKLLEWHFDIYGLIPNNLAIDINTL